MLTSAPTKLFVRYSSAGRNESSRMARRRIQSCSIEPGVVDLVRRRHVVRHQDDRRELVDPLADLVRALQLVEQVGDRQLVVRVLDLVEGRRLGLRQLSLVSISMRCCCRYSCALFSTLSRNSFLVCADSLRAARRRRSGWR